MILAIVVVIAMLIIWLIGFWIICQEYGCKKAIEKHKKELEHYKAIKEFLDKEVEEK